MFDDQDHEHYIRIEEIGERKLGASISYSLYYDSPKKSLYSLHGVCTLRTNAYKLCLKT